MPGSFLRNLIRKLIVCLAVFCRISIWGNYIHKMPGIGSFELMSFPSQIGRLRSIREFWLRFLELRTLFVTNNFLQQTLYFIVRELGPEFYRYISLEELFRMFDLLAFFIPKALITSHILSLHDEI